MKSTCAFAVSVLAVPFTFGQLAPPPFLLGGEYQLDSDLDGGGSFSRSVARARVSAPLMLREDTLLALALGYEFETFDFQNSAPTPWENIHRLQLGLVAKQDFSNGWSWLTIPYISSQFEQGAGGQDSLTFGGISAAWFQYNDRLSIGFGAGVNSRLEDGVGVFPILVIDWKLTDTLTLSTIPPEGFRLGPGASLRWEPREDLNISLVYQYQSDEQRLAKDSLASAKGVGEFRQHRVALAATYYFTKSFHLTGHAGLAFGGSLELQDASGNKLYEEDFDPAPVVGLEASFRF